MITFIDLFAGIGGFRRGMEMAGHKCVGFCEFDKYAVMSYTMMHLATEEQRIYIQNMPAPLKKNGEPNLRKRQQEILKEEYRNGEWYANDIRGVDARSLPRADCWLFGAPCQDFSIAGTRKGLDGDRSVLVREVFRLIKETEEENKPKYLIYENVKGMLSSNLGWDFACIITEMESLGYDIEYQLLNSKDFGVPQNRERVFVIGHLRGRSTRKVFPISGATSKDYNGLKLYGCIGGRNSQRDRIYSSDGYRPTLSTCSGRNTEPKVAIFSNTNPSVSCININDAAGKERPQQDRVYSTDGIMTALNAQLGGRHNIAVEVVGNVNPSGKGMNGNAYSAGGCSPMLTTNKGEENKIAIPVLTPDRAEKRQNGRRFKEDGEPMFTLTSQDRHGVGIGIIDPQGRMNKKVALKDICPTLRSETHGNVSEVAINVKEATKQGYATAKEGDSINLTVPGSQTRRGRVGKGIANTLDTSCNQGIFVHVSDELAAYAVWYEKYQYYIAIRKLTPKECYRLQGWEDEYFNRAELVNSDSQLYKQAGNGVTVNVVQAIAERLER